MHVSSITFTNFRNLQDSDITFDPGVNIITGPNGSGKTNLLEALATLCLGRSQRQNANDHALLKSNSESYRISGVIVSDGYERKLAVAFQPGRGKKITLNEQPAKVSSLFREFAVVSLAPEDSAIIFGSPGERRSYLDLHLSQASVSYLDDLSYYQRTLSQRNSHLKQFGAGAEGTPFDEQLIKYGSRITHTRAVFLKAVDQSASRSYQILAPGSTLVCRYLPSAIVSSSDRRTRSAGHSSGSVSDAQMNYFEMETSEIEDKFKERLEKRRTQEIMRETTLVGPHRDDFDIVIDNFPARTHSSQGEWRSAAITLKLAAFAYLKEKCQSAPLLLLDEVFAELDEGRQQALIGAFGEYEQLFLTTALEPPESLAKNAAIYHVSGGQVNRQ